MTPGIHPTQVKSMAPQPLSITASGGNITHKITLPHPILSLSYTLSEYISIKTEAPTRDFGHVQKQRRNLRHINRSNATR